MMGRMLLWEDVECILAQGYESRDLMSVCM